MTEPLSAALLGDYEVGLLDLLTEAIPAGNAISATRLAVDPAGHDPTELDDSRRCVEALIRRHWNHLVARGLIRGECVVTWHPDTGVPQILAATPLPEEGYSPEQVARQLSSAAAGDCYDPAEEPLTNGLFIDIIAPDGFSIQEPVATRNLTSLTGGFLRESQNQITVVALLAGLDPLEANRRMALVDRDLLNTLRTPEPSRVVVEAARVHVMEVFGPADDSPRSDGQVE